MKTLLYLRVFFLGSEKKDMMILHMLYTYTYPGLSHNMEVNLASQFLYNENNTFIRVCMRLMLHEMTF